MNKRTYMSVCVVLTILVGAGAGFGAVVPKRPPLETHPVKPNVMIIYDTSASMRIPTLAKRPKIDKNGNLMRGDYDPETDYTNAFQTYLDGLDPATSSLWKHMKALNNPSGKAAPFRRFAVYDAYENEICNDANNVCPGVTAGQLAYLHSAGYAGPREDGLGSFFNVNTRFLGNLLNFFHLNGMRDDLARQAVRDLVANTPDVNFGLMGYQFWGDRNSNGGREVFGGRLLAPIQEDKTTLLNMLDTYSGNLSDPTRNQGLIINSFSQTPTAKQLVAAYQYFKGVFRDPITASSPPASPLANYCQPNSIIVMTDGRPNQGDLREGEVAAHYCSTTGDSDDAKALDDLAGCLVHKDLSASLPGQQSLRIHTIGFANDEAAVVDLLQDTASNGKGGFYVSGAAAKLAQTFQSVLQSIIATDHVFTTPVLSPGVPGSGNNLYLASFKPDERHLWQGHLVKYALHPTTGNVQGTDLHYTTLWDAGAVLNQTPASDRRILTIGTSTSGLVQFNEERWSSLKSLLLGDDASHIRGLMGYDATSDSTYEQTTRQLIRFVQGYDVLDEDKDASTTDTRHKLADIFHSRPIEVGSPPYFYEDEVYLAFKAAHASRTPVVYSGSIMLHAFSATGGEELWAVIPPHILGSLKHMLFTSNQSKAQHYVDASPIVDDVFIRSPGCESSPCWRTVLMAGFRWGGRGYFALDVTTPVQPYFLWAVATDGTTVTYWDSSGAAQEITGASYTYNGNNYNYSKLGFTWSEPIIGRIASATDPDTDQWVAVVGGGHRHTNSDAGVGHQVYVIDLSDGHLVAHFDEHTITGTDGDGVDMGLHTALAGVGNANNYLQYLYASDHEGKLWKLNVSGSTSLDATTDIASWSACPLFTAQATLAAPSTNPTNEQNNRRHIYAQPQLTMDAAGKRWLLFGTGDVRNLRDPYPLVSSTPGRNEGNILVALRDDDPNPVLGAACGSTYTTANLTDVTDNSTTMDDTAQGWYIHLASEEKSFTAPAIYYDYVYFTTFIPDREDVCKLGDSYLYIVKFNTGGAVGGWLGEQSLASVKRIHLGSGVVTAPVIRGSLIYMGVSGIASGNDQTIIERLGGKRINNLIHLPLPEKISTLKTISWQRRR
ncbi:hypothetical protein NKDENANG_02974 [Candidatus Entotheonellaceae bacterium PAL068K]